MSCLQDIYESIKDIFIDCIFCKEENIEIAKRIEKKETKKRFKTKSTQTYISSSSEKDEKELIEPGS